MIYKMKLMLKNVMKMGFLKLYRSYDKSRIWDYSDMPFNIAGQICLLYGVLWCLLIPFAIWLEDKLNWIWWRAYGGNEPEYNYTLLNAYKDLFVGK